MQATVTSEMQSESIQFLARAIPTLNLRTGMLGERDCPNKGMGINGGGGGGGSQLKFNYSYQYLLLFLYMKTLFNS